MISNMNPNPNPNPNPNLNMKCEVCDAKLAVCVCGKKGCMVWCCVSCVVSHYVKCPNGGSSESVPSSPYDLASQHPPHSHPATAVISHSAEQSLGNHSRQSCEVSELQGS